MPFKSKPKDIFPFTIFLDAPFWFYWLGRGPQEAKTYIVQDMVITRFKGVLTTEEKHMVTHDKGKILVKRMRQVLREMYSNEFEKIVENLSHCKVLSSHSDISTKTGEKIEVFIVDKNLEKLLEE